MEATELMVIRERMLAVRERNLVPFSITSDCAVVLSALNASKKLFNDLGPLIEEVRVWAMRDDFSGFFHVSRLINGFAHKLARWEVSFSSSGGDLSLCLVGVCMAIANDFKHL